jgi:hypothetical protein
VYFELETESPVLISVRGLLETKRPRFPSSSETPGAHRDGRSTWASSTLERYVDAVGGRVEIHAVLDDADTKLTDSKRPPAARSSWRAVQSDESLARR